MKHFVEWEVNGVKYDLRLTHRNIEKLENALKPVSLLEVIAKGSRMEHSFSELAIILYYSLQKNHNDVAKNMDFVYDLCDDYADEGHSDIELLELITNVYIVSGIIPREDEVEETEEKND